jgi:hypothetical protein
MDLKMGSNSFRNSNGVLMLQGKEQVVFELNADTHQLQLTMDLYDAQGTRVAHVRRNTWVLDKHERYAFASGPDAPSLFRDHAWVRVTARDSGQPVFEAKVVDKDVVALEVGNFYTHKGEVVQVSSHYCRIGSAAAMFGEVKDVHGGPVRLGEEPA